MVSGKGMGLRELHGVREAQTHQNQHPVAPTGYRGRSSNRHSTAPSQTQGTCLILRHNPLVHSASNPLWEAIDTRPHRLAQHGAGDAFRRLKLHQYLADPRCLDGRIVYRLYRKRRRLCRRRTRCHGMLKCISGDGQIQTGLTPRGAEDSSSSARHVR